MPITAILESEGIDYKKVGREAVTLCPWHNDSHPSLTVNDDKNLCFCFACGGGSDGISYVQQKFSLSFADAVERIAERHGIAIEYDNLDPEEALRIAQQRRDALSKLRSQHESFRNAIRSEQGLTARQWLLSRKIEPATARHFEIGWATSGYFGSRVTVPIHDHRGTLVGFTGRQVDDNLSEQKYKNSASSQVFDKGSLIFNEHRALQEARLAGYLVFVEGHFDVISMWQYGLKNVVAMQGTAAPTIQSIRRLMRHCRRFVLCYDGDQGGHKAIEHFVKAAGPLVTSGELTLTVARMPEGKDPDDCIREGIDLHGIIEGAPQWLDWQLDLWLASVDRSDSHHFSMIEKLVRELVESIKSPALRQYYVDKAAKILAADSKAAAKLAQSWNKALPKLRNNGKWQRPAPSWVRNQVERRALRSYIHFPNLRNRLKGIMPLMEGPSHLWLWNRIQELEQVAPEFTPPMVMAVMAVCEPQYTRILRPLAVPTIELVAGDGILEHAERILRQNVATKE